MRSLLLKTAVLVGAVAGSTVTGNALTGGVLINQAEAAAPSLIDGSAQDRPFETGPAVGDPNTVYTLLAEANVQATRQADPQIAPKPGAGNFNFAELEDFAPDQPPVGGLEKARRARIDRGIFLAYQNRDYANVLALIEANPEVREGPAVISLLEAWSLQQLDRPSEAYPLFEALYRDSQQDSYAEGVYYSGVAARRHASVTSLVTETGGPLEAYLKPGKTIATDQGTQPAAEIFYRTWLDHSLGGQSYTGSKTALAGLERLEIETSADDRVALGWLAYRAQAYNESLAFFREARLDPDLDPTLKSDADYGYGLTLARTGQTTTLLSFLEQKNSSEKRFKDFERNLRLTLGTRAYEAGQFKTALGHLRRAESVGTLNRDQRLLTAWTALKAGDTKDAQRRFGALYASRQDERAADGLIAAYEADNSLPALKPVADDLGGPLAQKLPQVMPVTVATLSDDPQGPQQLLDNGDGALIEQDGAEPARVTEVFVYDLSPADLAGSRQRELAAVAEDATKYQRLKQLAPLHLDTFIRYRDRDGEKGTSRLTQATVGASAQTSRDRHRIKGEIRLHLLDADGTPDQNIPLGTALTPVARLVDFTTDDTVYDVTFSWERQDVVTLAASLGTTPINGEVDPDIAGHVSATYALPRGDITGKVYRRAVDDSILSFSGSVDPATDEAFGGVVESGVKLSGFTQISPRWRANFALTAAQRDGDDVDDNGLVDVRAGLTHDFRVPGFDYFALGPDFRYLSYDENLSEFTLGHGGYFSPQDYKRLGLGMYFMTDQGLNWLARGSVNVGYQDVETDDAPILPLTPNGDFYEGSDSDGVGLSASIQGAWLIGDQMIFEAGGYYLDVEEFQEFAALAHLRYAFQGRDGVFAQDLTTFFPE
ncbi:MAG: cellulose synthase subunit BcsC-related outer membrane protein [Pseudomonadota bacterium]